MSEPSREEILAMADELESQTLGGRAKAVAMLRRLAAKPERERVIDAPLEPTKEMAVAGRKALAVVADRMETAKLLATSSIDFWQRVGHEPANEIYRAMVEANIRALKGTPA